MNKRCSQLKTHIGIHYQKQRKESYPLHKMQNQRGESSDLPLQDQFGKPTAWENKVVSCFLVRYLYMQYLHLYRSLPYFSSVP